jgi:glycosyltransferase involved in cell wall biosynthesis
VFETMRIAFITAGAAGMFCGSCMRDNALVAALRRQGHDALLIPTYTPITLDEPDQTATRVFLGGINVYLQEKSWFFRHTPRWLDWVFDRKWLLKWAGRFAARTQYESLGELTKSMLRGHDGRQRKEMDELIAFLKNELKPDVVILTNVLLSGLVPMIRDAGIPVYATLQGDDIFLNALREADRRDCIALIRQNTSSLSGLIATSRSYADDMSAFFGIDRDRIHVIPAGIDLAGHGGTTPDSPIPAIGFFARIAPEKGFHHLIHAFIRFRQRPKVIPAKLWASGWFGEQHRAYFDEQMKKLEAAGLRREFEYVPSPDHASKVRFLQSIDLLSVPTTYKEPKGLYLLEAWANCVPAVLPNHGCFTELVEDTGGGVLVPPGDPEALADAWAALLADPARRRTLGEAGRQAVMNRYSSDEMARATASYLMRSRTPQPVGS